MRTFHFATTAFAALLLGALPLIAAHGDGGMQTEQGHVPTQAEAEDMIPNYFRHPDHAGWMYAHIVLMALGWTVVLPPTVMLSVARSRYSLLAQLVFHSFNGVGLFTGFVYNHSTPDLYVANSHHPTGWAVTGVTIVWTILSAAAVYPTWMTHRTASNIPSAVFDHGSEEERFAYVNSPSSYRFSSDSGNFSAGSRANSSDAIFDKEELEPLALGSATTDEHHTGRGSAKKRGLLGGSIFTKIRAYGIGSLSNKHFSAAVQITRVVIEKFLLLLGFVAIMSGIVVYGGLFRDREIYSGLAHYAKGGIFFWYGLLTLSRWIGAFAELGWAWNVRPTHPQVARWKARIPSAEFTESFVIWLYGASNVFLEHLNAWGGKWSTQDFEHVSITILFFGGGLLGMMIESKLLRDLMSTPAWLQQDMEADETADTSGFRQIHGAAAKLEYKQDLRKRPSTYSFSLNPMPALTIMFLGMMMSGHHQSSMVSTMMHAQWGMLFTGFAMARAVTYLMMYIKPPTSHLPSRPPSELVAAFCLTAGGIMFMNSAHDSVRAIEDNGLDAMTIFTLTIGLTGIIMAWELVCFIVKGWAARKESDVARG